MVVDYLSNNISSSFDGTQYKEKIKELENCYQSASKLTGHIFYLPIQKDGEWHIFRYLNGEKEKLSEEQFKRFITKG